MQLRKAFYAFTYLHFYSHTPHGVQRKMAQSALNTTDFYSHTPHGVQRWKKIIVYPVLAFLLTHPSRGATRPIRNQPLHWSFLLTHPSRGATKTIGSLKKKIIFLLTHPSRGATIRTPLSAQ